MAHDPSNNEQHSRRTLGWREWVALPGLGITKLKAKVDTGARTSALHAFSVETFQKDDGAEWVRFGIHPEQDNIDIEQFCEAPVLERRLVRDSGGHQTERIVIVVDVVIGNQTINAEVTLTSRDDMLFRMLLGRTAMVGNFVVDPQRSYVADTWKE